MLRQFDNAEENIKKSLKIYLDSKINNQELLSSIIHIYCSVNLAKKNNHLSLELIDSFLQKQFNEDLF